MTPLRSSPSTTRRAIKLVATLVAIVVALVLADTVRSGSDDSATTLSTQSLLTLPGSDDPTPTAIPTTAPLQLPTATPEPTATPPATATPAPTATTRPTASPTTPPEPATTASEPTPEIAVADAGSAAAGAASQPAPTTATEPAAEPTEPAPAPPTAAPTQVIPTPTTVQPTAEPTVAIAPQELPTAPVELPTEVPTTAPEPTPTPTPRATQSVAELENYVLGEINQVRANAGLPPVTLDPAISAISRDWSQQMALGGFFHHRPDTELNVMLPAGWTRWGENIASAPDIFYAQSSLENSPGHYENMVGPFTHVGIGVYTNGTQVWLTHNFARY